jgi:hypothetical protein
MTGDLFAPAQRKRGIGWCWLCQGERECDEPTPCPPPYCEEPTP